MRKYRIDIKDLVVEANSKIGAFNVLWEMIDNFGHSYDGQMDNVMDIVEVVECSHCKKWTNGRSE